MSTLKATVKDFLTAFDDFEGSILADPECDSDIADSVLGDSIRIELALEDADCLIQSFYIKALPIGRAILRKAWRRNQLIIARHYLDTVKSRQSVEDAFKQVLEFLESACSMEDNVQLTKEEANELGIEVKQSQNIMWQAKDRAFTQDNLRPYRKQGLFF